MKAFFILHFLNFMKKNFFSLTQNSPTKRKFDQNQQDNHQLPPSAQKSFTMMNIPTLNAKNQVMQFDHPDASPYVYSAILNSQNCRSARTYNGGNKNIQTSSQPSNILLRNCESDPIEQSIDKQKQQKFQNRRQPPRTATFRTRERASIQSKVPDVRMMHQIKKEIDSIRPRTVQWDESLNDGMFGLMAEPRQETSETEKNQVQIKHPRQKQRQGPVGPSVTILSGKIIVDNEPININEKPVAAPLISTKAFCQDYVGVPNSLSFMM